MCVNIVEYSRRNETGNTRMASIQYLLSLAILSIFSKVRTKSVTSMSINPLIGFTVCSCFLWFCLYGVCFILQEQSTFKVLANWSEEFNADVYIKVHPGSIPNVSTVHTTFSIETCIQRTLVHSCRGFPLNTGFTASLRAVTGFNVWRPLPHNERLQGWFKRCLTKLRSKSTLIGSPSPLPRLPRNSLHSPIFFAFFP